MAAVIDEQTQFVDSGGRPIVNGFIFIGIQNTNPQANPITIFSDRDLSVVLANPQRTDDEGRSVNKIWIPGRYSIEVEDLNNVQEYIELDNGEGIESGITTLDNVLGANAITADGSPGITAYVDKEQYIFKTAQVNTGDVTLDIDSVGVKSVLKNHTEEIDPGNFEADQLVIVAFNETDDVMEWVNQNIKSLEVTALIIPLDSTPGMNCSKTAADTLTITAGKRRDVTDAENIIVATTFTKDVSSAFVVGTGNGSLDTGTYAVDTLYAVWAILRSDTGVTDYLTSISFTDPTLPTNYDFKRLIAAFMTDGTPDIIDFIQSGDYFRYTGDVLLDVDDSTITSDTFEVGTLSVPPSCLAHIYGHLSNPTTTGDSDGKLYIRTNGAADAAIDQEAFISNDQVGDFDSMTAAGDVLVDSSSQIQYAAQEGAGVATVKISTFGFTMLTRRDP